MRDSEDVRQGHIQVWWYLKLMQFGSLLRTRITNAKLGTKI